MRRLSALSLAVACVFAVVLALAGASVSSAAARDTGSTTAAYNQRGFTQLNDCLSTHDRLDALYVMDVSGSLVQNDSSGSRFDALEASVAQLGLLSAREGGHAIDVFAGVSTFGDTYRGPEEVQNWTSITAEDADSVAGRFRASAERAWQQAGTNQGTNYQAAVGGALASLAARGSRENACQAVFWFTDGLFSLGDPYNNAATNAASDAMCAPGGLIDQARNAQVSLIALALTGSDVQAQLARPEYADRRGELQAMVVGRGGGRTCGSYPIPATARSGIYLSADDPTALGALFSGVAAQAAGCVPDSVLTHLPALIDVSSGVGRFQLDVSLQGGAGPVVVTTPDGTSKTVPVGSSSLDDVQIDLSSTGSLTSVTVTMPGAGMPGTWRVAVGDSTATSAITLYRCSNLHLEIQPPPAGKDLQAGQPGIVYAVVKDSTGAPADMGQYRGEQSGSLPEVIVGATDASNVSAAFDDPARGTIKISLTPGQRTVSTTVELSFVPRLKDSAGTPLARVTGSRTLGVTPPDTFPSISPSDTLDLGSTSGLDPASGVLTVEGSARGSSQVCFGPVRDIQAPAEAGPVSVVSSGQKCYRLDRDGSESISVTATPSRSADGFGTARLPVTLINADGEKIHHDLAVEWGLERKVNQQERLGLLLLALLVALLLPLIALALVNWWLARFESGDVRHATTQVDVDSEGVVDPAQPFTTAALGTTHVADPHRRRMSLGDAGLDFRARAPWSPLGSPRFEATSATGRLLSGSGIEGDGHSATVTAGLNGLWLFAVPDDVLRNSDEDALVKGRLTIITRGEGAEEVERLVEKFRAAIGDGRWQGTRVGLAEQAGPGPIDPDNGAAGSSAVSAAPVEDPFGFDPPEPPPLPTQPDRRRRRDRRDAGEALPPNEREWDDPFT